MTDEEDDPRYMDVDNFLKNYNDNEKIKKLGNSGINLGSGFDLGQNSPERLEELGFDQDFINRYEPFMNFELKDLIENQSEKA